MVSRSVDVCVLRDIAGLSSCRWTGELKVILTFALTTYPLVFLFVLI